MTYQVNRPPTEIPNEHDKIDNLLIKAELALSPPRLRVVAPQANGDGTVFRRKWSHLRGVVAIVDAGSMNEDHWNAGTAFDMGHSH